MNYEWEDSIGIRILASPSKKKSDLLDCFTQAAAVQAQNFHTQLESYKPTPLVSLDALAEELGVKKIFVKDESKRFSLNAFKGLGGSYAMFRVLCEVLSLNPETTTLHDLLDSQYKDRLKETVFVTATDGNHGRGVSWAGSIFGCQVHVYMPKGSAQARADAIRRAGPAEVTITDMNYDRTVEYAMEMSRKNGWHLIQDTTLEGYEKVPTWIIQGYLTMANEAREQLESLGEKPTHIFLQAGVGAMAGGVLGYFANVYSQNKPIVTVVEPDTVNCIYRSVKENDGGIHSIEGDPVTIMAGLNCGTPCTITWPILRDYAEFYMACPDSVAAHGMRKYAAPKKGDEVIISGESGAVTMGAVSLLLSRAELKSVAKAMKFDKNSVILLFSTEGDTDPQGYEKIVKTNSNMLTA